MSVASCPAQYMNANLLISKNDGMGRQHLRLRENFQTQKFRPGSVVVPFML